MGDELTRRTLFREVNARICEISAGFGLDLEHQQLLCECGHDACFQQIEVPASIYADIRGRDGYVVAPGHETVELVVSTGPRYDVIAPQRPPNALERGVVGLRAETRQPDAAQESGVRL